MATNETKKLDLSEVERLLRQEIDPQDLNEVLEELEHDYTMYVLHDEELPGPHPKPARNINFLHKLRLALKRCG